MGIAIELLQASWLESADRLTGCCAGLGDEEYQWMPSANAQIPASGANQSGRWTYDYDYALPTRAPLPPIGWRLGHLIADNQIYWNHILGSSQRTSFGLDTPTRAAQAIEMWHSSRKPISDWFRSASDADLSEPRPSRLGRVRTAGEVVRILLDEQIHYGAEIALLRDLYIRR